MMDEYLKRNDPVERAKRVLNPTATKKDQVPILEKIKPVSLQVKIVSSAVLAVRESSAKKSSIRKTHVRKPIPAPILHQVNLRDQGQCSHRYQNGQKCGQSRFIEIHHLIPVRQGGTNTLQNLITLCSVHHHWIHSLDHHQAAIKDYSLNLTPEHNQMNAHLKPEHC